MSMKWWAVAMVKDRKEGITYEQQRDAGMQFVDYHGVRGDCR
jgi:hypothetical protein